MTRYSVNPRVLVVTPEITYLPEGMVNNNNRMNAKAGGLADVSAALINALYEQGADVHVALPDYRSIFNGHSPPSIEKGLDTIRKSVPDGRIHLARDRAFFYLDQIYSRYGYENVKISLAFQREVMNNIVPQVQPDLIHCNDWMTGLIPGMARHLGIPCLFTIHNIHTVETTLAEIEDRGIDAALFWQNLFYERFPTTYENSRQSIPVDFLVSGVFASHFVNVVSPTFLEEIISGRHDFIENPLRQELTHKRNAGCAVGIRNAPDRSYHPSTDNALSCRYSAADHVSGKKANKRVLQKTLGLIQNEKAPIFFWPSRLDPVQKGCQLLAEILYKIVHRYWDQSLEVAFVADGEFQRHFKDIVRFHNLSEKVAVCSFNERLARLAYGASDFVLMPSSFEPCGLPQMIGALYGTLPVAHDTGGIHDTVRHLDAKKNTGNGFLFEVFDSEGLVWAIDQAMQFFMMPFKEKEKQIKRIMIQSDSRFNHKVTAQGYIHLYEKMLKRPLVYHATEDQGMNKNFDKKERFIQDTRNVAARYSFSDRSDTSKK